jgi:Arc/MetJ-type ribon-helix-helix transcriptional regulator
MTIEIHTPELEQRVQTGIRSGRFSNVDELLTKALDALDEQDLPTKPRKRLIEVLSDPAFAGSELEIEPRRDFPRQINL